MKKRAPDFELLDQDGQKRTLKDYRGRWVVLYFYPRDNALGCTREACAFRDEHEIIAQFGNAEVIAVNKGSVDSHNKFSRRHKLNFPVLSDASLAVTKAYGAWKTGTARLADKAFGTRRHTYIINPDGFIEKQYLAVDPKEHASEIIKDLQLLQGLVPA